MILKISAMNLNQGISFAGGFDTWASLLPAQREKVARNRMAEEVRKVRSCRMTVCVADWGLRTLMPEDWDDFGVGRCFWNGEKEGLDPTGGVDETRAKVYRYPAGHFDIFERANFSKSLEVDWIEGNVNGGEGYVRPTT